MVDRVDKKGKNKKKLHSVYVDGEETEQTRVYSKSEISDLLRKAKETESVTEIVELTRHPVAEVRLKSIQRLCPCRVLDDIKQFWNRIFEMAHDEDSSVRMQVLHNMCDGSPPDYESKVVEALEDFNRDEDKDIRRRAHKVIGSYQRTGKYNIL
mmetsp:Transcript_41394/g.43314  ORF Transcript_41394/g.43314 Transcript_41394/m.43314 type:complete len:154 (+) Transcript_41394:30-491(+)